MFDPGRNLEGAPRLNRRLSALCMGLGVLTAPAWAASPATQAPVPSVVCHVDYGGEVRHIAAPAVDSPYTVAPVEVGSYFLFRVVNETQPADLASVKVYVLANHDTGPVPIHQAQFAPSAPQPLSTGSPASRRPRPAGKTASSHGFTGLHRVYEPLRDGELTYWCEHTRATLAAPAPAPKISNLIAPYALYESARAPKDTKTVSLLFAGDLMLDDGPGRVIAQGGDPLADFNAVLRSVDHRIGNLEVPVATVGQPTPSKIYNFRADPRTLKVLQGRFDALSVANNHSGDYGPAAFLETLQHVAQAGIASFGGGRNLVEAHRPHWVERNGIRIAVLGYNEFKPRSFEAGATTPGIAWSEDSQVVADIRAARAAGADLVIPFMHWGWERERQPSERQRQLARTLIDAGADVVVGGHPHVTQGVDAYKGKLIVYSLGNFVFDSFDDVPGGTTGWLLRLTLDRRGLVRWDTVVAEMDADGVPHRQPGLRSPCGSVVKHRVTLEECVNP
ncbi:CapA family protein [Hydrogenophaga soli]